MIISPKRSRDIPKRPNLSKQSDGIFQKRRNATKCGASERTPSCPNAPEWVRTCSKKSENTSTPWKCFSTIFEKHFEDEGFYEVSSLNKYDCVLFSNGKNKPCSHISIYLGNGLILHQPEKSYSRIESLTGRHLKLIKKIIRHKNVTAN